MSHAEHMWLENTVTVCLRGHAYTPENSYVTPAGSKLCRACYRIRNREYHWKHRDKILARRRLSKNK
jgi:hypothetical protein